MADKGSLEDFKKKYEELRVKYDLPSFKELNESFEIECVVEEESDLILRRIRHQIMDRVAVNFRLMEIFLNPSNAPMFFFNIVKSFNSQDKSLIQEVYNKYVEIELDVFQIENKYAEKFEAEFIKKVYKENEKLKNKLESLFEKIRKNYTSLDKKQDKSYFG